MNFLNKKYTSVHSSQNHPTPHNNSKSSFHPSVREPPPQIGVNNCQVHPSELIRHMCLECIQMLCSECITQHLQVHRQAHNFPTIKTIKQVKIQMSQKLAQISSFMRENTAESINIELLKQQTQQRLEETRRQLIKGVEEWFVILRNHLLATLDFTLLERGREDLDKLNDEISMLKQALLSNNGGVAVVKKVYEIDRDKLQQGYTKMLADQRRCQKECQFNIHIDWTHLVAQLDTCVVVAGEADGDIRIQDDHSQLDPRGPFNGIVVDNTPLTHTTTQNQPIKQPISGPINGPINGPIYEALNEPINDQEQQEEPPNEQFVISEQQRPKVISDINELDPLSEDGLQSSTYSPVGHIEG